MPDQQNFDDLEEIEQEIMTIQMVASARRTAITLGEYIETRLLSGTPANVLERELIEDLRTGGRIFGELKSSLKATAHGNIRRIADIGNYSENGLEIDYTWVTVQDAKVCEDCRPNHGVEKKWGEWQESKTGLPRSGKTICRNNCRCFLAMSEAPGFVIGNPIEKERRKK